MSQSENQTKSAKKGFYLSIDLEDFTYDTYRNLNIEPKINFKALDKCYEVINDFLKKNLRSKKITFFTTGTVALTYPDLLKKISMDGHEIGCHYHFHDLMNNQSISEIESNIILAREAIKSACGYYPDGFRAPAFSISRERKDIYKLLSKYFKYDSSYVINEKEMIDGAYALKSPFNIDNFKEFPIVTNSFLQKFNLKSGGTFFRVFSVNKIKDVLNKSIRRNAEPLIYLHPYDFLHEFEFKVPLKIFLKNTSFFSGLYKYVKQFQWLGIGNKKTLKKLQLILDEFDHIGPMKDKI